MTVAAEATAKLPYETSVLAFRANPELHQFVRRNYLDEDLMAACQRFAASEEWNCVRALIRNRLRPGARVLDFGCGRGLMSLALADEGFEVTALDCDPSDVVGLGALARVLPRVPAAPSVVRGDATSLPFSNSSFDAAFCRAMMHHLTDLVPMLKEIHRVLKPGGMLVATCEHIIPPWSTGRVFLASHPAVRYGVDEHAYSAWKYWRSFRRAGLVEFSFFHHPLSFSEYLDRPRAQLVRRRLASVPKVRDGMIRLLYWVHVVARGLLFVNERGLASACFYAQRPAR